MGDNRGLKTQQSWQDRKPSHKGELARLVCADCVRLNAREIRQRAPSENSRHPRALAGADRYGSGRKENRQTKRKQTIKKGALVRSMCGVFRAHDLISNGAIAHEALNYGIPTVVPGDPKMAAERAERVFSTGNSDAMLNREQR